MKNVIGLLIICLILQIGKNDRSTKKTTTEMTTSNIKIKITVNGKTAKAILYDNPTGRDFAALLPLTLEMEDFNKTEKIVELSQKLSIEGAPAGFDPNIGDISYYEPWGNIALFYKDFRYSNGLVSMGKITSGLENFSVSGHLTAKFELE